MSRLHFAPRSSLWVGCALTSLTCFALMACSAGPDPLFADGGSSDSGRLPDITTCLPNNDGVIELSEVAFVTGVPIAYRINTPGTQVPIDVAGKMVDGTREWDFSARDGVTFSVALQKVDTQWFAPLFPNASHAVPADTKGDLLQVVQLDGSKLLLLGVVSQQPDQTRLVYDAPVTFLRFPLRVGDEYTSTAKAPDGKLGGLPIATEDTYRVRIDAVGTVRLPFVRLSKTLRIRVDVTSKAVGGVQKTVKQVQWFHECYGEIARIVSRDDESQDDFKTATEFRRLSF